MKENPTTFQLAQLAAQASPAHTRPKDAVRRAWELWREAEVEIANNERRSEYLRSLCWTSNGRGIPIFTDSPKDWQARLNAYPGDGSDVQRALWDKEFPNEVVQKELFKDKTLSRETRRTLFVGLAKACVRFDMEGPLVAGGGRLDYLSGGQFVEPKEGFPIHPKNLERAEANHRGVGKMLIPGGEVRFIEEIEAMLAKPSLGAHLVRWAVEVRQRQLAVAKSRVIPESLRNRRRRDEMGDSIQFKRTYRE